MFDTLREFLHVAVRFFRRNFCVNLRCANAPVSQHLQERLDRYVVRQADGCNIAVVTHVARAVLFDTAFLRYCFDTVLAVGVIQTGRAACSLRSYLLFLDDMFGYIQQSDICFGSRFLTIGVQPQMLVERGLQVRFRKIIRSAQTIEHAEDE